ncbi:Membrane-associated zinc metalloprotease [Rhodovulum sp. PH10]|uniref:RIP metalloprotease RseP n=1 Tax=Rhodovulum sp. PH10 TaxID=1187851 RepID=UPI00027C21AF|nr:RIP metalloprotease RseP [Rhodovulum sp. PH10]EJW12392.1 Membrane-associated zinc metalloprotease [Rhodovulum sp. PH10]
MGSNFLAAANDLGLGFLGYLIPFLFVLTIVVFFHELGHYLIAKLNGIKVVAFSIGFGPEIVGFNDRSGTRWKLAAIPLGGYVKFYGDENEASVPSQESLSRMPEAERKLTFPGQSVAARAAVVVAGPLANFVLAIVIFSAIFMFHGKQITTPRVDGVMPGSAAQAAGLQPGDLVLSIDGTPIDSFADMQRIVGTSAGETLRLEIERKGQVVTTDIVPALKEIKDAFGNVHRAGVVGITRSVTPEDTRVEPVAPLAAVRMGAEQTWFIIEQTLGYIGKIVVGRESADQLGGPIRIAQVSGQVATAGMVALLHLAAVLSVSIGLLNLFPVPLLDGGHLMFYAIEAVRGRPLSERAQEVGFRIGFALVVMLMIFATFNDILHLATS